MFRPCWEGIPLLFTTVWGDYSAGKVAINCLDVGEWFVVDFLFGNSCRAFVLCRKSALATQKLGDLLHQKPEKTASVAIAWKKGFLRGQKKKQSTLHAVGGKVMDALTNKFAWDSTKQNGVPKNASQKWKSVPSHSSFSRNDSGKFPSCLKREINNLKGGATTGSRYGIHTNQVNPELREHSPSKISPVTWQNKKCNLI